MNEQTTLGKEPPATAGRDAIHVAVAPVVADHRLEPGQRVGVVNGRAYGDLANIPAVGVVDPFLTAPVERGGRLWVLLFPGTITGLRHVWTSPAFPPKLPPV